MVSDYLESDISRKILLKFFHAEYHGKQLMFGCPIVALSKIQSFAGVCERCFTFLSLLNQNGADSHTASISVYFDQKCGIKMSKNWCSTQNIFQVFKGSLLSFIPNKWLIFLRQVNKWVSNCCKIRDVAPIITCQPKKRLN